ncbi:hypothetical protein [Streptomyces sp. NPDC058486]|uniref:hypothetical protein n=1 Tax=unclassified Streptomyces TaxID=2593676 RepID=UPI003658295B
MKRWLTTLMLSMVMICGAVQSAETARADGAISSGVSFACEKGAVDLADLISGNKLTEAQEAEFCGLLGEAADRKMEEWWDSIWNSVLGDVIKSASDAAKWVLKLALTAGLRGPSLDLQATGLFGEGATLYGMLLWLGLIISLLGMMWQIGKMALTGQAKHLGRAMLGWVENMFLSTVGVALFAILLAISDAMTNGLIDAVFQEDGTANEQFAVVIAAAMVPYIMNPVTALAAVGALLLIACTQMVVIFLRQSAIPLICLMLPIAGGGRAGGDATRQWAPKLITSGLVIVAYKPILAVIICTGFAQFGHAVSVVEWLRGLATLVLAVFAPGPLFAVFAPFGAAVGGGMAGGGAKAALQAGASYLGGKLGGDTADGKSGGASAGGAGGGEGGETPGGGESPGAEAVAHSQLVSQTMGSQSQSGGGGGGDDAQAQAARNAPGVPVQAGAAVEAGAAGLGGQAGATGASGAVAGTARGNGGAAAGGGLQVLDGVNDMAHGDMAHGAGDPIGGGGEQT